MSWRRATLLFLLLLVVLAAAFIALGWRSAIAPVEPPARTAFDTALIDKGAELARVGNCMSCHTADGGRPYAGGRPIVTAFGTLYGTNITPDRETGIGRWSQAAFVRSMREGVDRAGRHLYPAFPYDHFTRTSDADLAALYAYLMTRAPVRAQVAAPDLPFPLNVRMTLSVWKLLFLEEGAYRPDPQQSAQWNRGRYLADGLAHCGSCHTPRNFLGAEKARREFAGGDAGGWHAPALDETNPAPAPWNAERLYAYLRHGMDDVHSVPAGPMASVVRNLALVPEGDVRALAAYFAARMPADQGASAGVTRSQPTRTGSGGGQIYVGACASCHEPGRAAGGALELALSTAVALPTPRNLIHIIRDGIVPPEGESGAWMPAYAGVLTDAQLVELVSYLRQEFGRLPAWENVEEEVRNITRGSS